MDFYGNDGVDVAITAYMDNQAAGTIDLYFVGGGYGNDPTNPGLKIQPHSSTPRGDRSFYVLSTPQLDAWQVASNDHLRFTVVMRGTNIPMTDVGYFLSAVQGKARLRAAEAGHPCNGNAPYGDVDCGALGSGLAFTQDFTLQLA